MPNWTDISASDIAAAVTTGETTAREVAEGFLTAIQQVDPEIRAYLSVHTDRALQQAEAVDADRATGKTLGPLAGVPVALKANMALRGEETNCGSRILEGWRPPYTGTAPSLLEQAGAVIVGTANMDEFAMGSSTENSAYHVTRNPWNTSRVPGGSSGGSAAAVSAREAAVALGSDTGGSIRQPASFCGVVGLKPTYGRISRYGLVAYASSLDQIGPIGRTVKDVALLLGVLGRHDPLDSTSANLPPVDPSAALGGGVEGMKIGKPVELFGAGLDPGVRSTVEVALETYRQLGAHIVDVSLPYLKYSLPVYYIIAPSEASSNLARYDGVRYGHRTPKDVDMIEMFLRTREEGFGAEVKRRIMIGTYALSSGYYDAWYKKAQQVRTLLKRDFDAAFEQCDVMITPTAPTVAFGIGDKVNDPYQMYLQDVCTIPVNLAGLPAMSQPCGFSDGMPVGMQIIARHFDEAMILRVGQAYEQATDWHQHAAPVCIGETKAGLDQ